MFPIFFNKKILRQITKQFKLHRKIYSEKSPCNPDISFPQDKAAYLIYIFSEIFMHAIYTVLYVAFFFQPIRRLTHISIYVDHSRSSVRAHNNPLTSWMYHEISLPCLLNGHLGYLQSLATTNKAAMIISVSMSFCTTESIMFVGRIFRITTYESKITLI